MATVRTRPERLHNWPRTICNISRIGTIRSAISGGIANLKEETGRVRRLRTRTNGVLRTVVSMVPFIKQVDRLDEVRVVFPYVFVKTSQSPSAFSYPREKTRLSEQFAFAPAPVRDLTRWRP